MLDKSIQKLGLWIYNACKLYFQILPAIFHKLNLSFQKGILLVILRLKIDTLIKKFAFNLLGLYGKFLSLLQLHLYYFSLDISHSIFELTGQQN